MQLEQTRREVSSSGTLQVAKATIKATPKIFDMFANDTYANKPLAIMRELVANGIDAHVAAGRRDRPVEVKLPCSLDPTCVIRDFGTGMSHDFVMGPFMAYTDGSTKDKSDDAIGGFGIGSKSPFAYVDQYTLRVVHEGVLSVYTMFKDEDGIPAVGLQGQTTTDEPNGVEVSFPVEEADMQTFMDAAQAALQYFQPLPIVTNGTLNGPDYTYVGTDWAMRPKAGPLGIIMGGVRYPVTTTSLDYSLLRADARLSPLLEYGLDLTLPIGACGVAMSREQLSYIPKTSTSIASALSSVIDDVVATFANFFDSAPSEWDAMKMLAAETGMTTGSSSGRAKLLMNNARYHGQKLETSFRIAPTDFADHGLDPVHVRGWMVDPQRARRSSNCPPSKWVSMVELYGIEPYRIETVIIDDLPQSPRSKTMARIREFVTDQPQAGSTLIVRGEDENATKQLLALLRNPTDYVLTSSMPEPQAKAKLPKGVRPRVRMFSFNGTCDRFTHSYISNLTPADSKRDAVKEIPYPAQPATGIMVVMNSFDLPGRFRERMEAGLVRYDELVFVNATDEPKLKATFERFEDVFEARLAKALAAYPDLPQRIAVSRNDVIRNMSTNFMLIDGDRRYTDLPSAAKNRPFGRLYETWRRYVKPLTNDQHKLKPFVTAAMPAGLDPTALQASMEDKQPDVVILLNVLELDEAAHRKILFSHL